ncbi:MAG: 50S ribosomal protein L30 [Coriobacteriales bacterium]|jgi:large subunit ribosomal protein L30|nr:50S ribosomal protein L30 [Coriobacteriales bacterium]
MAEKKLRVTQVRSAIGHKYDQAQTIKALGIHHMNQTVELVDNPSIRGMLFKVKHLVKVEEI